MSLLHEALGQRVDAWREAGYPVDDYPTIAEILQHAYTDEEGDDLRYLRRAQFKALETYWHLRLVERTPRIIALYERLFEKSSVRPRDGSISSDRSGTESSSNREAGRCFSRTFAGR